MPPDWKPDRRIVDPEAGKEKVRADPRCRSCRRRARPVFDGGSFLSGISRSHIVAKGIGGDDVDENIAPLCGSGTSGCHGLHEAMDMAVRQRERRAMLPEEEVYARSKMSDAWFEKNYPTERSR